MRTMRQYRRSSTTSTSRIIQIQRVQLSSSTLQKRNIAGDILKSDKEVPPETQERFVRWLFHGTSPDNIEAIVKSKAAGYGRYLPYLAGSAVGAI